MKKLAALLLFAAPLFGQSWPLPSKSPNVAVPCLPPAQTKDGAPCAGQLTAPYSDPLRFGGRYLDSTATRDFQTPIRTLRARAVRIDSAHDRLYMILGGGLLAGYDFGRFMQRVVSGEHLVSVANLGAANRGAFAEMYLPPERFFYAERSTWNVSGGRVDGQDRLLDFDWDDRGNVAVGYDVYGWGLLNSGLQSLVQGDEAASQVILFRLQSSPRYFLIATVNNQVSRLYEVTNPSFPVRLPDLPFSVESHTRLNDGSVVIVDGQAHLRICAPAGLVAGLCVFNRTSRTGNFKTVDSDGVNVFAVSAAVNAAPVPAALTIVTPTGVQEVTTRFVYSGKVSVRVGAGHLVLFGTETVPVGEKARLDARNLRLFRISSGVTLTEIPLVVGSPQPGAGQFFKNYYMVNSTPGYVTPLASGTEAPGDVALTACGVDLCMLTNANALGDLWRVITTVPVVVPATPPVPPPATCPCPPAPTLQPAPQPPPAPAPKPPAPCTCSREHQECCRP
jgi:hypothetical protein